MPKRPVPLDARLVDDLPEPRPIFVALKAIDRVVIGTTPKTWSNWIHQGIGPRPYTVNGRNYFKISEIVEFFENGGSER